MPKRPRATRSARVTKRTKRRTTAPRPDAATPKLDPRLARAATEPAIPPRRRTRARPGAKMAAAESIVPATERSPVSIRSTGSVIVPATVSRLPLGRLALLAQASRTAAQRLQATDRIAVLVEAEPSREGDVAGLVDEPAALSRVAPGLFVAHVGRTRVLALAGHEAVRYVEASVRLRPHCELAHASADLVVNGRRRVRETGKNVLIGVVDTGVDVSHAAFQANGKPRVVYYLDQATRREWNEKRLAAGTPKPPRDEDGHGTHVAGIAAGNGGGLPDRRGAGVAPDADLAVVKTTFSTAAIANAVARLFELADERKQPCVINLSLGTHAGGHDGSSILERAIDTLCERPGRVVVVSAGNEGDTRLHAGTALPSGNPAPARWVADFELNQQVVDDKLVGVMNLEVWTQHEDDLIVRLRSPNGELFEAPATGSQQVDRAKFALDASHRIARYSRDHCTAFTIYTVAQAQWLRGWSVIVEEDRRPGKHGVAVGAVHAWIEDEDMGFFKNGFTKTHLVGMPGTAAAAITVASYATRASWVAIDGGKQMDAITLENVSYFSSPGPTRDGINKPDVAGPGQWVVSALSSQATLESMPAWLRVADVPYAALQGTSMAAPYVTGAVALLFERHPDLHCAEVKRRLIASTAQDRWTRPCWNERWGHGKIDVARLLGVER